MPEPCCAAVILAAGASTRLGTPKQLIRIDGESLLRRSARMAVDAGIAPVFVVLGFQADQMEAEMAGLPVKVVLNESWEEGMSSSVRCGVAAVAASRPQPAGVVLMVCDQPRLSSEHLRALLGCHAAGGSWITASSYAGKAGVPAVFCSQLFPELQTIRGDRGARDVIAGYPERTKLIPWPEGAVDLDVPEDLTRVERQ